MRKLFLCPTSRRIFVVIQKHISHPFKINLRRKYMSNEISNTPLESWVFRFSYRNYTREDGHPLQILLP
ncbi:unnamed protein product [Allacma fusca]|uniref:Uncharacterized protein n=1 Tax=Allacma fusca TaxID=39272 RepID=A0A8J2L1T3_9HEXA|nr:unnamed protein product [Allacma fusca]